MQTDNPTMNAPSLSRFSSEVLLVFIGHSSDADTEAKAICDLERDLQRELERLQNIANAGLPFKTVRFWEWNYDAPPNVGGQDTTISPDLDRANIAIFVFKERVGVATWDELERSRNRTPSQIPVVALFSANPPESKRMADLAVVEGWSELLKKKRSLAADWMAPNSKSLRPTPDYEDVNHLNSTFA